MDAKAEVARKKAADEQTREHLQMEAELAARRREAARARIDGKASGASSVIESSSFELPNPGGGENLLEDVCLRLVSGSPPRFRSKVDGFVPRTQIVNLRIVCQPHRGCNAKPLTPTPQPGHRYGLIGRNGKGKSTLLRWIASGRVKGFPPHMSMHYVSQELPLADINQEVLPIEMVLRADVERELLLEDFARFEAVSAAAEEAGKSEDTGAAGKMAETIERLTHIDADGAEGRARAMLVSLGFSEELLARPMKALSGGWRVRVALVNPTPLNPT